MDPSYWQKKWQAGDIGFHRAGPHPKLVRGFSKLPPGRVMVPLCGKSPDLLWLRSQGHKVVGIELSQIACEAFFAENGLPIRKQAKEGALTVYAGDGITLWCGDFFAAPQAAWEGCTALYDRAALVALPNEARRRYAHIIRERVGIAEMLLVTVEYGPEGGDGPPFSISETEVTQLFGERFDIRKLETDIDSDLSGRRKAEIHESAYSLHRKKIKAP